MGDVVEFRRPEQKEWHHRGEARCIRCKHEFEAVISFKLHDEQEGWIDCPGCGCVQTARFKTKYGIPKDENGNARVWVCRCGNELFYITLNGWFCPNCGREHGADPREPA